MASVEELTAMITAAVQAALQSRGLQDEPGDRPLRRSLDERFFRRVKAFSGGEAEWKDWMWEFRNAVGRASKGVADVMDWIQPRPARQLRRLSFH